MYNKKGFTLIELLVVIAILAVLAVTVTLILNPAELVRQGRDSTRMSDMATLNEAVNLYFSDQQEFSWSTAGVVCTDPNGNANTPPSNGCSSYSTSTAVDGSGWVGVSGGDIKFDQMSTGAPISRLPVDPVQDSDNYYVFIGDTNENYELNAHMESDRYSNGGDDDVETTDGGDDDNWYEVGNAAKLNLSP